jgi:hypothetical protein
MFHIGPEMVECLMRKAQAAESKEGVPKTDFQRESGDKQVARAGRAAPYVWTAETVASALFLILRCIL